MSLLSLMFGLMYPCQIQVEMSFFFFYLHQTFEQQYMLIIFNKKIMQSVKKESHFRGGTNTKKGNTVTFDNVHFKKEPKWIKQSNTKHTKHWNTYLLRWGYYLLLNYLREFSDLQVEGKITTKPSWALNHTLHIEILTIWPHHMSGFALVRVLAVKV